MKKRRPGGVTLAATLQLLLALTFLISAAVAYLYGADAQALAEAELARQGFPAQVLTDNNVRFDESAAGLVLPIMIALCVTALALLNLAGNRIGRILTWIFQPTLMIGGGIIIAGQVFVARSIELAFESSSDSTLKNIDVQALVEAAKTAFPGWYEYHIYVRFALVTLGSLLVIVLLALPSANAYFRKEGD